MLQWALPKNTRTVLKKGETGGVSGYRTVAPIFFMLGFLACGTSQREAQDFGEKVLRIDAPGPLQSLDPMEVQGAANYAFPLLYSYLCVPDERTGTRPCRLMAVRPGELYLDHPPEARRPVPRWTTGHLQGRDTLPADLSQPTSCPNLRED